MLHNNIKVGRIYYVDFDPFRKCEFNGKHLAVVLRKNDDNNTLTVLPLTSSDKGIGKGKIELGILKCLPETLQSHVSYAAVNSIRTVNYSRFSFVFDNGNPVEPILDDCNLKKALYSIIGDITYNIDEKLKTDIFKNIYIDMSMSLLNNLLYRFLRETKNNKNKTKILKLKNDILDIMINIPYKIIESKMDKTVMPLAKKLFIRNILK